MNDAQTLRKIRRPTLPRKMLPRPALVRWLEEAIVGSSAGNTEERFAYKLVLLQAPAGYGKTTLLADFARATTIPCCWVILDRSDTDPVIFLETLLMSIRARFPASGAVLDPLLSEARAVDTSQSAMHRFDVVVDVVAEAIASQITERFALILCNYHEIDACQPLHRLMNRLLRLPSSCTLVIESRSLPPLDFALLLARREMTVLHCSLLRLNAQEIQELASLQANAQLSDMEAEQLASAFDGWLVGLLLGTRLGDVRFLRRTMPEGDSRLEISLGKLLEGQHLFAYVVHEVFERYPDEYTFLKEACVLEEMSPALCAALLSLPVEVASERLAALEQYGLFVSSQDSQAIATCHPAVRDLLVEDLRVRSPDRFSQLHRRAANLLAGERDYERAITHALAAKADELAADLIVSAFEPLRAQGHLETLARWMEAVSEPIKVRSPIFLLSEARVAGLLGDSTRALERTGAAQAALDNSSPEVEASDQILVRADIAIARGVALCLQGKYQEAQAICQQALTLLPTKDTKRQAEAQDCLGRCALHLGEYPTALAHLQQALHAFHRHADVQGSAAMHMSLNMIYRLLGHMALAEHHCTRALACYEQLHNRRGLANAYLGLGSIRQSQGLLSEAETFFTQSLTLSREPVLLPRVHAYALVDLGELFVDQGYYDRALTLSEEALLITPGDALVCNAAWSAQARSHLLLGDVETARLMLSRMILPEALGKRIGKYHAEHHLIEGLILLKEQRPAEAQALLTQTEMTLETTGMKLQQIQANVLIAACHLEQNQISEVMGRLEKVGAILTAYECYEQRIPVELRHLRALSHAIRMRPEAAHLRALFHLEAHDQDQKRMVPFPTTSLSHQMPAGASGKPRLDGTPRSLGEPERDPKAPLPDETSVQGQPTPLRVVALGEPLVLLDEQPVVRWRMARALELFFYLLDAARPLRKEQIITALWPETEDPADHTFHNTIYYVRKAIGVECLVLSHNTYTLDLSSRYGNEISYDVARFETGSARAKAALAQQDEAAAALELQEMVALYRGDYLLPLSSAWCMVRREGLRLAYLDAHLHLAQLAWHRQAFEECIHHWQHIVTIDPCREEAHAGLIRCYLRQGKRGLALHQYRRCRETLRQELGIEPGPSIQRLAQYLSSSR